ncbi:hypothetical protein [Actinobacillus equuli]|uniref:Uncharacterized protein n=1 Tax=Actinobacillus equuli TaxID=718 RepID=A0AAX3FQD9_ACTEU|nr:hypothetical protein [Actinobacillus equuli]WGE44995.1 hypothetical protein NYR65_02850 [Actinobacillus equuli subsp. equuli]VEE92958.1 Uncharacterised protein [Actinobacillus equuli]
MSSNQFKANLYHAMWCKYGNYYAFLAYQRFAQMFVEEVNNGTALQS